MEPPRGRQRELGLQGGVARGRREGERAEHPRAGGEGLHHAVYSGTVLVREQAVQHFVGGDQPEEVVYAIQVGLQSGCGVNGNLAVAGADLGEDVQSGRRGVGQQWLLMVGVLETRSGFRPGSVDKVEVAVASPHGRFELGSGEDGGSPGQYVDGYGEVAANGGQQRVVFAGGQDDITARLHHQGPPVVDHVLLEGGGRVVGQPAS
ncbi:vanillate O-demethylase ferredoxin subunit [Babesia caballi]|uniref:Vanillate O-demethylase ferredoxin subunit n=1 Tax=Babesia caballi TaxID=5871 RepID=A0AAV4M0G5_BABCB|nr:vanillate O-demethylase ferredoxin subunit [Babesia caballi]